ncbi:Hypothetical predicted protein [Pelobates cultripes]|uniref:Uncharacterized protein n=1 Tax=Pelobates cultripes TaxID=61616 RepID=A0AAD1VP79_PELCU|nr:Hypothetical predicted protein [Pelobates cultripes]
MRLGSQDGGLDSLGVPRSPSSPESGTTPCTPETDTKQILAKLAEEVEGSLIEVVTAIFRPLLPDVSDHLWHIESTHRALWARQGDDRRPRDVNIKFLSFQTKEALMRQGREGLITYKGAEMALYQDLTPTTFQRQWKWRPATELLQQHSITNAWGHPFRLLAFKDGRTKVLHSDGDPVAFLRELGIQAPERLAVPTTSVEKLRSLPREWYTAGE